MWFLFFFFPSVDSFCLSFAVSLFFVPFFLFWILRSDLKQRSGEEAHVSKHTTSHSMARAAHPTPVSLLAPRSHRDCPFYLYVCVTCITEYYVYVCTYVHIYVRYLTVL